MDHSGDYILHTNSGCGKKEARITVSIGVLAHPLDELSRLDCSTIRRVPMPKRAVFERSRR